MSEDLISRLEARAQEIPQEVADRDNSCQGCCGDYGTDTWDDHADDPDRLLMLEAVTVLKSLKERLDRAEVHAGFLDEEADFTVDELLKCRNALKEIAQQKLTEEMDDDMTIAASFEDGYNECVRVAREALENK